MPILKRFGKPTVVGAEPGQAQLLKLLNNMLSSTAFAVTAEAFVAGVKGGLDPKLMLDVLNISSGRSAASQEKLFVRYCRAPSISASRLRGSARISALLLKNAKRWVCRCGLVSNRANSGTLR